MNNLKYVVVSGYFATGSSAIVDLLKEYDGFYSSNIEFRLIKDPYGLIDLRHNLIDKWDPLNADNAIKDFMWFTRHLSHQSSKLSLTVGMGYSSNKIFGDSFDYETNRFINELIQVTYQGTWLFQEFKKNNLDVLLDKILRRFNKKKECVMYFSAPKADEFDTNVRNYLDNLLIDRTNNKVCILDQAFPAQNPYLIDNFLNQARMIIVDRDPRDVYVDIYKGDPLLGAEFRKSRNVALFISWYKSYRINQDVIKNDNHYLFLRFEEVVKDYDETNMRIQRFLGVDSSLHNERQKYFVPNRSEKNIGLWKTFEYPEDIKQIESELQEYLYGDERI